MANAKAQNLAAAWKVANLQDTSTPAAQMLFFNLQREERMWKGQGGDGDQVRAESQPDQREEERDSVKDHVEQSLDMQLGFNGPSDDLNDPGVRRDDFGEDFH